MNAPAAPPPVAAAPSIRWPRVFAVLLLLLLFAEVGARTFIAVWAQQPYRTLSLYRWSPYGLVRNNPNVTSPKFRISPNGFRNPEVFTREKPKGTLRVLMMGGSVLYAGLGGPVTVGDRVGSDETIAQFLRDRLRADPALAGVDIEVINAGVNFNRIAEISTSYLAEYVFWNPDVVIVCGSANNFWIEWPRAGTNPLQAAHPWKGEFDRIVNERTAASWLEGTVQVAADHLASLGMLMKAMQKAIDLTTAKVSQHALVRPQGGAVQYASAAETEAIARDYFGFTDAVVATARTHGQDVAFVWEPFLGALGGVKPMSADEQRIYDAVKPSDPRAIEYQVQSKARLASHFDSAAVPFIDPEPALGQNPSTVFIDYLHYTSEGNDFIAGVIFDRMRPVFEARAAAIRAQGE
jgi:hypothetical protein